MERVELLLFFSLWKGGGEGGEGTPVDGEYEPQIEYVDLDVLGLFTSRTDKAYSGDLSGAGQFISCPPSLRFPRNLHVIPLPKAVSLHCAPPPTPLVLLPPLLIINT